MAGPGQPQRLRALSHADIENPQPLTDREARGYLLVELPGDELLADGVAQPAEPSEPRRRGPGEPVVPGVPEGGIARQARGRTADRVGKLRTQGRSPRLTCGFGRRSRRI
ncbi:hypothetical protein GCM10018966_062950 [Streptomyces yanii]